MTILLDVKGLHSGYGRIPILVGIDMAMQEGEYLGVLGHNGMGKTTLLEDPDGPSARDGRLGQSGRTGNHDDEAV